MANIRANAIYYLINAKGETALDLSGGDNKSIIGYGYHGGANQAWTFQDAGADLTYYLKSEKEGKYLAAAGELRDGQDIVATDSPYAWYVQDEPGVDGGVRLSPARNKNFCVDLSNYGNPTPGTPVQLWGRWDGQNQVWKLRAVQ